MSGAFSCICRNWERNTFQLKGRDINCFEGSTPNCRLRPAPILVRPVPPLTPARSAETPGGSSASRPPTCAPRRCHIGGWGKRTRAGADETGSLPAGSTPARPRRETACNVRTLASALLPQARRPKAGAALRPDCAAERSPLPHLVAPTSTRRPRLRRPTSPEGRQAC